MRLAELTAGLPVTPPPGEGWREVEVVGVAHDSRAVAPGDLFVAWAGERHDGRAFAPQAVERGAAAVLAAGPAPQGMAVPWLAGADPRALLAPLAARVYAHPDRELVVAGVTGTNGKSTVATLIAAVLEAAGRRAGFIGTLGYRLGGEAFPGERTTPEASDLFRTLRAMRQRGARAVAMEVSSHALEQGRVAGLGFDVAVFTNLTRDHLEYHGSMESYFAAKRRLFELLKPAGRAAVNLDDHVGPTAGRRAAGGAHLRHGGRGAGRGGRADDVRHPRAGRDSGRPLRPRFAAARPLQPGEPSRRGRRGSGARSPPRRRRGRLRAAGAGARPPRAGGPRPAVRRLRRLRAHRRGLGRRPALGPRAGGGPRRSWSSAAAAIATPASGR